ncbi:TraX family protein [Enterococcus sp. AZ126]|uniref:TraX family protein n=1 Tax=Enterococcus sp. AZ126 TaxID=2774635 RepID=UPI003F237334
MDSKSFFSGSQLKWIAIIAMLLDHTAKIISFQPSVTLSVPYAFEPTTNNLIDLSQALFPVFIMIGRLAFPIFCFLLVEGFIHTSNTKKYLLRLSLFAFISEIPYDLAFSHRIVDLKSQNVFFTLLIGLLAIIGLQRLKNHSVKNIFFSIIIVGLGIFAAQGLHTDYGGWIGVLLIVVLYLFRDFHLFKCVLGALILLQNSWFGLIAFIPIYFYNGQRGKQWKYFFYWFYPAHLLVLIGIQQFLILPYFD